VNYKNGTKKIVADNLEQAEKMCNKKIKSWTDIYTKPKKERI
jgi:hypothetical protein